MNHALSTKTVNVAPPAAIVNNASVTMSAIDTKDFDTCTVHVILGATDIALTALKMTESDSSGSGYTDVTGLVYGTSTNIAGSTSSLPSATDDNKVFTFDIDCRGRKRYLKPVLTVGSGSTGAYSNTLAILSRPGTSPVTASDRGAGDVLRV